jgi:hypothetical protein
MSVVLRSCDVSALEGESHGVFAGVTKALVPQRGVNRRGIIIFVSKEGSELTGTDMKMRKIVVHDEDEVAICITCGGLSDGRVGETDVVPSAEMLLRDDGGGAAFGRAKRIGGLDVELTRVAILVGEVELNEPIPINVHVGAFDVDGGA